MKEEQKDKLLDCLGFNKVTTFARDYDSFMKPFIDAIQTMRKAEGKVLLSEEALEELYHKCIDK